jgi:hypothetical protein
VLHDLAVAIQTENVNARPIAVTGPVPVAMQNNVIVLRDSAPKLDTLTGIFACHPLEVFDKRSLPSATVGLCWM